MFLLPTSYWFTALGYFNIILPSFLPKPNDLVGCFWHRARSARAQTIVSTNSPLLVPKSLVMSAGRQARAQGQGQPPSVPRDHPQPRPEQGSMRHLAFRKLGQDIHPRRVRAERRAPQCHDSESVASSGIPALGAYLPWFHLVWDQKGFGAGTVERFWEVLPEMLGSVCTGDLAA